MRATLSERPYASLRPFCRAVAASSEGARLVEVDGVLATIVPVAPERSVVNSVVYDSPEALAQGLEALREQYDDAGIRAWTVWVRERDAATQALLARAGHKLDATPSAMAIELHRFDRSPRADVHLVRDIPARDVGRLNDVAYGFDGDFSRAFGRLPAGLNLYGARIDGETVACVGSIHADGDCGIYLVATHPAAQGRGLASDLVTAALRDGRAAGCETASLQSTAKGKPLYTRLGFRDFGAIQMWERRIT
jgi:ribosomal protein S18 acetylase RimI-like enzyme